jgi:hypothetical protein
VSEPATTGATSPGTKNEDLAGLDQYRRWARFLFAILAILAAIGLVLVPTTTGGVDPGRVAAVWPLIVILTANVAATLIVLVSLIRGLSGWSTWAIHAVQPVCIVLIVIGGIRALIAITQGQILLPLETFGGLLVLTRPHLADLLPPATADDRRRVAIATGVTFASYFVPLVLPVALA